MCSPNRMFDEMLKSARLRLAGRKAEEISEKSGIVYEKEYSQFHLNSLGKDVFISYPDYEVNSEISEWHLLTILHYMDMADGSSPANSIISFSQLKNGMVRGGNFDRKFELVIEQLAEGKTEERIRKICKELGAEIIESNADLCAVFSYLPLYPVTMKIWFADDEFPATGRLFLDKNADCYLTVEDAVTVGEVILESLMQKSKNC